MTTLKITMIIIRMAKSISNNNDDGNKDDIVISIIISIFTHTITMIMTN